MRELIDDGIDWPRIAAGSGVSLIVELLAGIGAANAVASTDPCNGSTDTVMGAAAIAPYDAAMISTVSRVIYRLGFA